MNQNAEQQRLHEGKAGHQDWKRWGPYLSERQWGTVREDYSPHGNAWEHLPHDHARSRAYRWGEDGIAGISDDEQRLCLSLVLWNGKDPILKERLFGLTNSEGNHGEDVKELYYQTGTKAAAFFKLTIPAAAPSTFDCDWPEWDRLPACREIRNRLATENMGDRLEACPTLTTSTPSLSNADAKPMNSTPSCRKTSRTPTHETSSARRSPV